MIHPDTALCHLGATLGYAVVATAPLPRGTITWVQDPLDQLLSPDRLALLPTCYADLLERYTYFGSDGIRILIWDFGRHINHSCDPNCAGTMFGFEVALRDIAVGEPLTNDYGTYPPEDYACYPCDCGASSCRGQVGESLPPADEAALLDRFNAALSLRHLVPQPLMPLLDAAVLNAAVVGRTDASTHFNSPVSN